MFQLRVRKQPPFLKKLKSANKACRGFCSSSGEEALWARLKKNILLKKKELAYFGRQTFHFLFFEKLVLMRNVFSTRRDTL